MNPGRLRELSVVLGLVLMVILGGIVVLSAGQPPRPGTTTTPTAVAGSPSPTLSGPASLTAPPTDTPVPSATPTTSPPPTPSPTWEPPAAGEREIGFVGLGLDSTDAGEEPLARYFTFDVEGAGKIEATVSDVTSGRVRMCLWRGDPSNIRDNECDTTRGGSLTRDVTAAGQWTVSLIGARAGASPSATLLLRWPASEGSIHISNFRFQGQELGGYNGFEVEVATYGDGPIAVAATLDDGQGGAYPWRLEITAHEFEFTDEGESTAIDSGTEVINGYLHVVKLFNRQSVADQRVLLTADLDWP